jgi:prepilin peptidase CpaA
MSLPIVAIFLWGAVLAALALSVVSDLKDRIVPDVSVILIAILGLALCLMLHPGEVWLNLVAGAAVFFALGTFCHYGLIGGGDVKLAAAVTLLVTPDHIGTLLIEIALAGGFLSCFYLGAAYFVRSPRTEPDLPAATAVIAKQRWLEIESARIASGKSVPYALAISGGLLYHLFLERL